MSAFRDRVYEHVSNDDGVVGRSGRTIRRLVRGTKEDTSRDRLMDLLPPGSVGAEVGVHRGDLSERILDRLDPARLHLIDPWLYFESSKYERSWYGGTAGGGERNMERRYRGVLRRFRKEIDAGVVVVHRGMSWDVAESFDDDSLDWVYIDADHSYESVRRDLAAYLPKVKAGGLITGDDYFRGQGWWGDGVVRAVDELIAAQPMEAVMLDDATHQWALRKPLVSSG